METLRDLNQTKNIGRITIISPTGSLANLISFVGKEKVTAARIKDRENRQNVSSCLESILYELKQMKSIPEAGIAIYAQSYV